MAYINSTMCRKQLTQVPPFCLLAFMSFEPKLNAFVLKPEFIALFEFAGTLIQIHSRPFVVLYFICWHLLPQICTGKHNMVVLRLNGLYFTCYIV